MAESIVPSGYFGTGHENIHIVEHFLSESVCDKIYEYCQMPETWNHARNESDFFWKDRVIGWNILKRQTFLSDLIENHNKIKLLVEEKYKIKAKPSLSSTMLVKWNTGLEQDVHGDKENADGTPQNNIDLRHYDISTIVYINDDFEGGEIYLPQHDISIKPKKGLLVCFPGDRHYLHGVSKITSGTRFTLPYWWAVDEIV